MFQSSSVLVLFDPNSDGFSSTYLLYEVSDNEIACFLLLFELSEATKDIEAVF